MTNEEITDLYYKEAVKGLNEVILEGSDLWYEYVVNLPMHLQVVYTIIIFHQQIFNGGFHQYFYNSYGQFAYLTIEHLQLIKAFKTSDILEKALSYVNYENLSKDEFRLKVFNRKLIKIVDFDEKLVSYLDQLDNDYDETNYNLEELLVDYLEGSAPAPSL